MGSIDEQGTYRGIGLNGTLQFKVTEDGTERVCMDMPITSKCFQPFGYVHGGATLALLEAAASRGAELRTDLDTQRPFGTHVDVHHVRNCREGVVHGVAELVSEEDLGDRGTKQVWNVTATDDAGNLMSTGTFTTRIVPLAYLEQKQST